MCIFVCVCVNVCVTGPGATACTKCGKNTYKVEILKSNLFSTITMRHIVDLTSEKFYQANSRQQRMYIMSLLVHLTRSWYQFKCACVAEHVSYRIFWNAPWGASVVRDSYSSWLMHSLWLIYQFIDLSEYLLKSLFWCLWKREGTKIWSISVYLIYIYESIHLCISVYNRNTYGTNKFEHTHLWIPICIQCADACTHNAVATEVYVRMSKRGFLCCTYCWKTCRFD